MKKLIHVYLASLLALSFTCGAFASTPLSCGTFAPNIPGATVYQVEFNSDDTVTLTSTTFEGLVHTEETVLPKTFQGIDGAAYENSDFKVWNANIKVFLEDLKSGNSLQCK